MDGYTTLPPIAFELPGSAASSARPTLNFRAVFSAPDKLNKACQSWGRFRRTRPWELCVLSWPRLPVIPGRVARREDRRRGDRHHADRLRHAFEQ